MDFAVVYYQMDNSIVVHSVKDVEVVEFQSEDEQEKDNKLIKVGCKVRKDFVVSDITEDGIYEEKPMSYEGFVLFSGSKTQCNNQQRKFQSMVRESSPSGVDMLNKLLTMGREATEFGSRAKFQSIMAGLSEQPKVTTEKAVAEVKDKPIAATGTCSSASTKKKADGVSNKNPSKNPSKEVVANSNTTGEKNRKAGLTNPDKPSITSTAAKKKADGNPNKVSANSDTNATSEKSRKGEGKVDKAGNTKKKAETKEKKISDAQAQALMVQHAFKKKMPTQNPPKETDNVKRKIVVDEYADSEDSSWSDDAVLEMSIENRKLKRKIDALTYENQQLKNKLDQKTQAQGSRSDFGIEMTPKKVKLLKNIFEIGKAAFISDTPSYSAQRSYSSQITPTALNVAKSSGTESSLSAQNFENPSYSAHRSHSAQRTLAVLNVTPSYSAQRSYSAQIAPTALNVAKSSGTESSSSAQNFETPSYSAQRSYSAQIAPTALNVAKSSGTESSSSAQNFEATSPSAPSGGQESAGSDITLPSAGSFVSDNLSPESANFDKSDESTKPTLITLDEALDKLKLEKKHINLFKLQYKEVGKLLVFLMDKVWTREQIAASSAKGSKSAANRTDKSSKTNPLPAFEFAAIKKVIFAVFPTVRESDINRLANSKCSSARRSMSKILTAAAKVEV